MVDEFAPVPLEIRDVMLFDDEAAPVRGSAGKDNPRPRISGENFVVCCTQNWNIRLCLHHHCLMTLAPSRFAGIRRGQRKSMGGETCQKSPSAERNLKS